nr:M23 family metallopeptidase [Prevotella sp.]
MKRKIVALWAIICLAVSSAKAQFNTVSDNVCRYKVKKVEEKFLLPANQPVDSIQANLLQQETDSVDSKQKQWISSYPSITYPLKSIKVTSHYGYRRDPFTGKLSWHNGLDLRAKNEPTYAMMDGIVEKVGYDNRSGNYVTLRHGNYHVSYCHLSSIIVRKGEYVYPGIIVGVTGNTGHSTGNHLHLTCKKDGKSFNPTILLNLIEKSFALSALSMSK